MKSHSSGDVNGGEGSDNVGGLVGWAGSDGSITESSASGTVRGGPGGDNVGGLLGLSEGLSSSVTLSYATGNVYGEEGGDSVGGLVGRQNGMIVSSYASGAVYGGPGSDTGIGGLVGQQQQNTSTISSYATGNVYGGADQDNVGGLTGQRDNSMDNRPASIIASYATGAVDGGEDTLPDDVGSLVGEIAGVTSIPASYGFGELRVGAMDTNNSATVGNPPVSSASALASGNAGAEWSANAWNFGNSTQAPVLKYVDAYASMVYTCTSPMAFLPAIRITCGTTLLPGQRR